LLRIVGIQRSEFAEHEFILLQNQGSMRANLRSHIIVSDDAIDASDLALGAHAFAEEVLVPAGMFVILHTGPGEGKWARSKDGTNIYNAFMGRCQPVWSQAKGALHILQRQHSYAEPKGPPLLLH